MAGRSGATAFHELLLMRDIPIFVFQAKPFDVLDLIRTFHWSVISEFLDMVDNVVANRFCH
jgi:hypothetical protein